VQVPRRHAFAALLLALSTAACAPVQSVVGRVFPGRAERWARSVTIHRDAWGVPHVLGPTDASVVFGLAYAQAEDNFWQVEEDFIRSIGRASELDGEAGLADDLVRAAFDVERLSRAEYQREPDERRELWNAFAAGLNYYLRKHPAVQPRLIRRFEPWFVFARFRSATPNTRVDGARLGDVLVQPLEEAGSPTGEWTTALALVSATARDTMRDHGGRDDSELEGSNAWAVAPSRSASGHALLFQNPHVGFFGAGQRYEAHLHSDEGYRVSGFAILGTPVIRSGHNEHLGWTHTNTAADAADAFLVEFSRTDDPLAYRQGQEWRAAVEWEDTLRVRVDTTLVARRFRFKRTHHGPVVRLEDGKFAAVRIARFEDGGSIQQWLAMGRAVGLETFRSALAQTAFPISNTMYADTAGNILFVQGNAVPKRAHGFDWTHPVDGSNPETEWQGYHALEDLPQLLNPESGWLQNTNSTPFLATADGSNLERAEFPAYVAPENDNARARVSREILGANDRWTFEQWAQAAFDRRMIEAADHIPAIIDEWERIGGLEPDRAVQLDAAIEALRSWDGISTEESPATTLFVLWFEQFRRAQADTGDYPRLRVLDGVVADLRAKWDTVLVPWGELNRLQRVHTSGTEPFLDDAPSIPVAGAPAWTGIVFNVTGRPGPSGRRRYGSSGHTWVGIVEFAPRPITRTIVTFGQSADPDSPHWFDQAPLYATGRFKEAWFWPEEVLANARRSYRPADRE